MRQIIGFAVLITIGVLPIVVVFVEEVYLLVKCIKEGGDWEFYAADVLAFCVGFIMFAAILAIVL